MSKGVCGARTRDDCAPHTPRAPHSTSHTSHGHAMSYTQNHPWELTQVAWFDETHPKRHIGGKTVGPNSGRQTRFPRGPNGELQPDGTLQTKKTWLKCKFDKEIRLLLGCAMVKEGDKLVGKRCRSFSYTNCWVHNITKFQEQVSLQISRAKKEGKTRRWVTGRRPNKKKNPDLFQEDSVARLKGVSAVKKNLLASVNIHVLKDLLGPHAQAVVTLKGIGAAGLAKLQSIARTAKTGSYVSCQVDHRRSDNPYKSRYPETWEQEIAADLRKHGVICITELVEHMITTTKEVMAGTEHAEDWFFYHDALTQLTDKRTKDWMVEKGHMKRWLLPILPCNSGTIYEGRPVGNTPEVMPWDCSLNQDVHVAVDNHALYFSSVGKDNPLYAKRFSKSSPSIMSKSYLRILDPVTGVCPSSDRIIQDIQRCWGKHIDVICEHKGSAVEGIGDRNGVRNIVGLNPRGGVRKKTESVKEHVLHPDAEEAWTIYLERSIRRHSHSSTQL